MPFKTLNEVEFNFIWVGGNRMPDDQAENLLQFVAGLNQYQAKCQVWVDNKKTYSTLVAQFQERIAKINANIEDMRTKGLLKGRTVILLTFKNQLKNLSFTVIDHKALDIPTELNSIIENTRAAKLWGGMSDIYRLLILSRKHKAGEAHVRIYIEADNRMQLNLWQHFNSKAVSAVYEESASKYLFAPATFRVDLLLLDITAEQGQAFAASIRPNLVKMLVSDLVLKLYFAALLQGALENEGLYEDDVLGSYGSLTCALFRLHFMTADPATIYGFKDLLLARERVKTLYGPLSNTNRQGLSWLDKSKEYEPLYAGALQKLTLLRICEISDVAELTTEYTIRVLFSMVSKQQFMGQVTEYLKRFCEITKQPIPEWFIQSQKLLTETTSPAVKLKCSISG
jgi:hypothetical protein